MSDLAPVRTMPVRDLALQLGDDDFDAWVTYKGVELGDLDVDRLLLTDADFQRFLLQRYAEEIFAFKRLLKEADFLDETVADFFGVPETTRPFLRSGRTVREWAEQRLLRAEQNERLLFS